MSDDVLNTPEDFDREVDHDAFDSKAPVPTSHASADNEDAIDGPPPSETSPSESSPIDSTSGVLANEFSQDEANSSGTPTTASSPESSIMTQPISKSA